MWISRRDWTFIRKQLEEVQAELSEIRFRHQRLLDHLGLAEWKEAAKPVGYEIITKEEYAKRLPTRQDCFNTYLDQLAAAQAAMRR